MDYQHAKEANRSKDRIDALLRALCYFAATHYPPTLFELWKYAYRPEQTFTLAQAYEMVSHPEFQSRVETVEGYVWPKGHDGFSEAITQRSLRYVDAQKKFKRLRFALRYMRYVPGVVAAAAVNTLAWWQTKPESDIDLLIITEPNRLWTARFFLILPFKMLGLRPTPKKQVSSPFCFSFFVASNALSFDELRLTPKDSYFSFWFANIVPVYDSTGMFKQLRTKNSWVQKELPHAFLRGLHPRFPTYKRSSHMVKKQTCLGNLLEHALCRLQRALLPASILALANRDTRVVISDTLLKFHENDRRAEIQERFESLCKQLNV